MTFPNQLSVLRLILAGVFLFLFLSENVLLRQISIAVYFVAVLTDWYDGWHARKFGLVSRFGIFVDPLADKVLTSAAFVAFYRMGFLPLWMLLIIVIRDIVITVLRSVQELGGKTMTTSYIAKVKTFIQMAYIFAILLLTGIQTMNVAPEVKSSIDSFLFSRTNYALLLLITVITFYTGVSYFLESKVSAGRETN